MLDCCRYAAPMLLIFDAAPLATLMLIFLPRR